MLRAHREALELQRVEPEVHRDQLVRHAREQRLAVRGGRRVQPARVALVRDVGELAVGPHQAAVLPGEEEVWLAGNGDERVLVGVHAFGVVRVAVLRQVAEGRAAVAGEQHRAAV